MSGWFIFGGIMFVIFILMVVGNVGARGDYTVNATKFWHKHD